ncbi:MAG: DUF2080 family transposase-associated protein [Candidatus Kariarchaeaceae archaeon]|jgi:putative transposon-encoded protein
MIEEKEEYKKSDTSSLVSLQLEGYEIIEKVVKSSGNSGRVYLPSAWIGSTVKIIRITPLKNNVGQ